MPVDPELLESLARSLSIVRDGPAVLEPGQPVNVRLAPDPSRLTATDILRAPVDLTFLAKNIRYGDATLEPNLEPSHVNSEVLGGLPIVGTSGVPSLLGQIEGTIPIPVQVGVRVDVRWSVRDDRGEELTEGDQFVAPDGLESLAATLSFAVNTVELTTSDPVPAPALRQIHAEVKLTAGGTETGFIPLPSVPVFVPSIPIPTVLAMFLHTNFQRGAVLVVVPASSPLRSIDETRTLLDTLRGQVARLTSFANFVAFLTGLDQLRSALAAQPHVQFRVADAIRNLNNITLVHDSTSVLGVGLNDTEAEDELSSMVLIGPESRRVELFVARNLDDDEGQLNVAVGPELFAMIRSLHARNPSTTPEGRSQVVRASDESTFGDELSSLRFSFAAAARSGLRTSVLTPVRTMRAEEPPIRKEERDGERRRAAKGAATR